MNILFLSPLVPYPPVDGDRQRSYHLLRALARRHCLHLLCFARSREERRQAQQLSPFCASVRTVDISHWRILLNSLAAWPTRLPLNVAAFSSGAMRRALAQQVKRHGVEIVHAYRLRMAPYALAASARFRILDYTDALTRYFQARGREAQPFWKRCYLARESAAIARYEVWAAGRFDAAVISAPADRDALYALGAAQKLEVVSNGVDTGAWQPAHDLPAEPRVLFVGNAQYPPNARSLEEFCRRTLPRIRAELPKAVFNVAGRLPAGSPRRRQRRFPGAEFLGIQPDLQPLYHSSRVAVCPLRVAAGRQFKVIESFAAGVPVVATPVVAENLRAVPEEHLLVADAPVDFARQVVRLCRDTGLADRLRRNARALAERDYDWSVPVAALTRVYQRLEQRPGEERSR